MDISKTSGQSDLKAELNAPLGAAGENATTGGNGVGVPTTTSITDGPRTVRVHWAWKATLLVLLLFSMIAALAPSTVNEV